ncbi:hypothetical protein HDV05_006017, partial [Chytridiales sp. JEL 0842]
MGNEIENRTEVEVKTSRTSRACGCSKKVCIILTSLITFLVLGGVIGACLYFFYFLPQINSDKDAANNGGQQTLKVGEVTRPPQPAQAFRRSPVWKRQAGGANTPVSPLALGSTNSYNYAVVDGLRVRVVSVTFTPDNFPKSQIVTTNYEEPKWVEMSSESTVKGQGAVKNFIVSVKAPVGMYVKATVRVQNTYAVKAYCKTANHLVYTSATGIKRIDVNANALPGDYDYFTYPFAWPAISTSPNVVQTNDVSFETHATFNVLTNSSSIAALMESRYSTVCYDGVPPAPSNNNGPDARSTLPPAPFGAGPTNAGLPITTFFPTDVPNFGLVGIPIFAYL